MLTCRLLFCKLSFMDIFIIKYIYYLFVSNNFKLWWIITWYKLNFRLLKNCALKISNSQTSNPGPAPVSASHDKSPPPTGAWARMHGTSPRREHHHRRVWGDNSPRHASTTAGGHAKQLTPTRVLMLAWPAERPSHRHHLPLFHTQAQPEALKHPLRRARA
jgi:hypothetical protein